MSIKDLKNNISKKPPIKKEVKKSGGRPEIDPKDRRSEQLCLYLTKSDMEYLEEQSSNEFIKPNQLLYKLLKQNGILPK